MLPDISADEQSVIQRFEQLAEKALQYCRRGKFCPILFCVLFSAITNSRYTIGTLFRIGTRRCQHSYYINYTPHEHQTRIGLITLIDEGRTSSGLDDDVHRSNSKTHYPVKYPSPFLRQRFERIRYRNCSSLCC